MAIQSTKESAEAVGTRSRAEVEAAVEALESVAPRHDAVAHRRGALSGYRWALGHIDAAPVTGAPGAGSPGLEVLTAEVDAAHVQLEGITRDTTALAYTRGVHEALAWVCGHRDDRP